MTEEQKPTTEEEMGWQLKKEVPIATILTVLFAIGSGSFWMMNLRTDLDLVRHDLTAHELQDAQREARQERTGEQLLTEVRELRKDITALKVGLASSGHFIQQQQEKK